MQGILSKVIHEVHESEQDQGSLSDTRPCEAKPDLFLLTYLHITQ
jgi:hypothetical protein